MNVFCVCIANVFQNLQSKGNKDESQENKMQAGRGGSINHFMTDHFIHFQPVLTVLSMINVTVGLFLRHVFVPCLGRRLFLFYLDYAASSGSSSSVHMYCCTKSSFSRFQPMPTSSLITYCDSGLRSVFTRCFLLSSSYFLACSFLILTFIP